MDIAGDHVLRVGQDRARVVGEQDLAVARIFAVKLHIVHAGERVQHVFAEQLAILRLGQHVAIGIDALFLQPVKAD